MTSRIKVMRIIARMNVGGPALQVVSLARWLDDTRFDQRLFTGSVEPGEADYLDLRADDIPATRVPGLGRSVKATGDARAFAGIVRHMREFRPDIVHTHTAKAGVLGRLAARACRVPYTVHTFHGHLLHGYFSPAKTAAVRTVERTLARGTTALVAVGAQVGDDLIAAGIGAAEKFTVVPPGVELPPPPAREEARRLLGLPLDAPTVAFVARLTPIKRPDRFVAVAERVLQEEPAAVFVVAGEGPLLEATRQVARELGDKVRFMGWRADVETVYAASDVVALTSDNEGMPVSLIEAALCGRPAVTTRVGSAPEVVLDGVTGFVCELEVPEIADRILQLVQDAGMRHQFGTAARTHSERAYGARRLANDIGSLYQSLIGDDRGRRRSNRVV